MAHKEQRNFCEKVKNKLPQFFKNKKVLDIGSLDINGSNRDLFENCDYLGIDVGEGKNVDFISVGHLFEGPDNYFDTIISTEVFEHDMFYEDTIKNIMRMLKPGGLFLFTCAAPGRPEHGTRRCGEDCAPLLIQISEEWADYYKNLDESDIRKINGFNETFPDCYFELNNIYCEIPADLYFYGVKNGEKYLLKEEYEKKYNFNDDIFVIDSWPDNETKENDLINLIKNLKEYNIPILLTGHYPIKPEIQKMVDYYLFDKNNDILLEKDFDEYSVNSGRWTENNEWIIENKNEYHHDYAIWSTMKMAFNFVKTLNKKYIHFLEYDNLPNHIQYRQSFLEYIRDYDAVLYEYRDGSINDTHLSEYCATFIFSIRTDIAINVINKYETKYEYFIDKPKGWQLERVFLSSLKEVTNDIFISKYIANNNELNTQAVWNRDGIVRNGAKFQIYLATDEYRDLYVHFISGFHEEHVNVDYLVEVNYGNFKKFYTITKGTTSILKVGKYQKGNRVKVFYQGNIAFNEYLKDEFIDFKRKNYITFKNKKQKVEPKLNINFIDGPFVEILNEDESTYLVEFINKNNNKTVYSTILKNNHWAKCSYIYFINWKIKITGIDNDYIFEYDYNPNGKRILISFESKSLGDNLAWISYVEQFRLVNKCEVVCSTFFNYLFKDQYPNIEFVEPGTNVTGIHGLYRIGLFYNTIDGNKFVDYNKHLTDPKKEPLTKIASDILGLKYEELKPNLKKYGKEKKKQVSIAIHSTAQLKYWNNPNGWQEVVDFLNEKGYVVILLSLEEDGYMGNRNPIGVIQHPKGSLTNVMKTLEESEFFIGISSGLSWLSWAVGTPTILISGFTDVYLEPINGIKRIINKNVCNGCWHTHDFDPSDWNFCPINKNTERQFECSKTITSKDVIQEILNLIN